MKVGDRVRCVKDFALVTKGMTGRILKKSDSYRRSVEWDCFTKGHTCAGMCKEGCGYNVPRGYIELIGGKGMKKSDLKTGMWVEYKDGDKRMVLLGTTHGDFLCDKCLTCDLRSFEDDLSCASSDLNIVKVYQPIAKNDYMDKNSSTQKKYIIWERTEPTKMTVEEIQEKLGYKVEIVEG